MKKSIEVKKEESVVITIHQKIIELKNDIGRGFIKLGAYLKEVRDKNLYIEKGCESFEEYIGMPELSFSRSMVFALIGVFEDFFQKSTQTDLMEIGYVKLDRIRQFKGESNFEEWIEKAKTLSLSDLNAEIRETRGEAEISYVPKDDIAENITCPFCGKIFQYRKNLTN